MIQSMRLWHPHTLERGSNFSYMNEDPTFLKLIKAWYESLTLVLFSDPNFSILDPGSMVEKIPDPGSGSTSKNVSIFIPKKLFPSSRKYDLGFSSRIQIPDLDFLPIPDPGVKKARDPGAKKGTGSRIRNIVTKYGWKERQPERDL
jgi:hypothetical protein